MLMILSGCSAVGKNTVIKTLLREHAEMFCSMPTYTTRAPRPGEREGDPYCFLTDEQFRQKIAEGELYEYEQIHTSYYGSSRKLLAEARKSGKVIVKDIDVKGALNLSRLLREDMRVVTVFLYAEKELLRSRLRGRGDAEADIAIRLRRYDEEMSYIDAYDYRIENLVLADTVRKIIDIAKRCQDKSDSAAL